MGKHKFKSCEVTVKGLIYYQRSLFDLSTSVIVITISMRLGGARFRSVIVAVSGVTVGGSDWTVII